MTDRWARPTPLTGIVFVALMLVSVFLPGSLPSSHASGASIIAYARANHTRLDVSALLIGFSVFFALFFYGQLRAFLRRVPSNEALASIAFGGAVLFAAGGGVTAGTQLALADSPGVLEAGAAQALNVLARDVALVLFAGLGVLMFAAGLAIVRSRVLSVWLGWAGIVLGIVVVLPLGGFVLMPGAAWTLAISVAMAYRAGVAEPGLAVATAATT